LKIFGKFRSIPHFYHRHFANPLIPKHFSYLKADRNISVRRLLKNPDFEGDFLDVDGEGASRGVL
jgi:hypothetical protein